MRADKRTSNLFIAGGYCLVAIIILLNYLGQTNVKDKIMTKPEALDVSGVDDSVIARQLKEEKRVNLEMREMLTRLQGAISDPQRGVVQPLVKSAQSAAGKYDIPDINYDLLDNNRPRTNPFIPGKNPFAAPTRKESAPNVANKGIESTLRSDPRLPFVISGASSRSGFSANF
ncbi:MAG: hypothetical protein CVV41_12485 [Candidatus Riflebacteria bacterium HGW-Riflebacteria-1]|jgi:hypothetical protein|nr:MAG: hypothetical protein CVV41_12485 [Candidatus Riflebacteria bacterium HGW-Riflebacteria-1]